MSALHFMPRRYLTSAYFTIHVEMLFEICLNCGVCTVVAWHLSTLHLYPDVTWCRSTLLCTYMCGSYLASVYITMYMCWYYVAYVYIAMYVCRCHSAYVYIAMYMWKCNLIPLYIAMMIYSETCLGRPPLERPLCLKRPSSNLWRFISTIEFLAKLACLERPSIWKDHFFLISRVVIPDKFHCITWCLSTSLYISANDTWNLHHHVCGDAMMLVYRCTDVTWCLPMSWRTYWCQCHVY